MSDQSLAVMLRPAPKFWLKLFCTLAVTVSLCGMSGFAVVDTGSVGTRANIVPGSERVSQALSATLPNPVCGVARADRPATAGSLPLVALRFLVRATGFTESVQSFPLPRSVDKPSPGAALVGIVELRL